jgi:hypothetical protein
MKRYWGLLLLVVMTLSGLSQSCQSPALVSDAKIQIIFHGEEAVLVNPALLKDGYAYISSMDMDNFPGLTIDFRPSTGDITITGKDNILPIKVGEPLKAGDDNGAKPFLQNDILYLPVKEIFSRVSYIVTEEKNPDTGTSIILETMWSEPQDQWKVFTDKELDKVNTILAKGITITDQANDWAPIQEGLQPDGRKDNGQPYPISFTDVKSITLSADEQYLYIKTELYGVIPNDVTYWQNTQYNQQDFIMGMCCNFDLASFLNRNTGLQDQGLMQTSVFWVKGDPRDSLINPQFVTVPILGTSSFATNSGTKDKNNEDIYTMSTSEGRVGGGAGFDYFIGVFALKNFGLQFGDVIECDVSLEIGSKLFHHECVDVILDCGYKAGETIRWKIGTNTYENLGPAKNLMPPDTK